MFTGLYNVDDGMFSSPLSLFQGVRAFFPLFALYICIVWMIIKQIKPPIFSSSIGMFFYFWVITFSVSFLSPNVKDSLYWGGLYLAPVIFLWIQSYEVESLQNLRWAVYINYGATMFLVLMLMPQVISRGMGGGGYSAFYQLPFGLGSMTRNGVGRFALVLVIVSSVRFLSKRGIMRYAWLAPLVPSLFILYQAQSRTALLGLAVISVLLVLIKGAKWQFLLAGPVVVAAIWISGFQMRSRGDVNQMLDFTGRLYTWMEALAEVGKSPFLGWGFNADRIVLNMGHVHNSYFHSLLQGGILGFIFFAAGLLSIWYLIIKYNIIVNVRKAVPEDYLVLVESILIFAFLFSRSFFEATASFYGVDLLILLPAIAYIYLWSKQFYKRQDNEDTHTHNVLSS
ncbi:O-antigen ligase family protein [Acidobacteriota bacterium]